MGPTAFRPGHNACLGSVGQGPQRDGSTERTVMMTSATRNEETDHAGGTASAEGASTLFPEARAREDGGAARLRSRRLGPSCPFVALARWLSRMRRQG